MRISIFGLGYVGCISLGCLAKNGHNVIGVDVFEEKVSLINKGIPTVIEKEIDVIIRENFEKGRINATTDYKKAVQDTDVSIICVGTPSLTTGHLNLDYIFQVAEQIGKTIKNKNTHHSIFIRSTVPPNTNKKVSEIIEKESNKKPEVDFSVVSNPEFLREGTAVFDYYNPPYTIIASKSKKGLDIANKIYSEIDAPIIEMKVKEAEILKYINNSYHALKITFGNEVGNVCKKLGIDSHQVMSVFCQDTKLNISPYYFKPGFAYGGSCLPKDLKALLTFTHDFYIDSPILNSIDKSNTNQIKLAIDMILETGMKKIGFLGLSFKPGTDDLRYSPILEVIEVILGKGYDIKIYDNNVHLSKLIGENKSVIESKLPHVEKLLHSDIDFVIYNSDVIVIANKEKEFENLNIDNKKVVIDLARIDNLIFKDNYQGICW